MEEAFLLVSVITISSIEETSEVELSKSLSFTAKHLVGKDMNEDQLIVHIEILNRLKEIAK